MVACQDEFLDPPQAVFTRHTKVSDPQHAPSNYLRSCIIVSPEIDVRSSPLLYMQPQWEFITYPIEIELVAHFFGSYGLVGLPTI